MTVGTYDIKELKELVHFSYAIFCAKTIKIEKLKNINYQRRYTFKINEILFQEGEKKFDLKSNDKITVFSHYLSRGFLVRNDGTMLGAKGPLKLSYSSYINEADLKIGQEIIVFIDYGYIKQDQFELAADNSFESMEKKKEIENLIEERLQDEKTSSLNAKSSSEMQKKESSPMEAALNKQSNISNSEETGFVGGKLMYLRFTDLVFKSEAIAVGELSTKKPSASSKEDVFSFEVVQSLKRQLPKKMAISFESGEDVSQRNTKFHGGEEYLLFLINIKGESATALGGDMGIWPRKKADWIYSEGHVQPLDQVLRIIDALLKINGSKSYEERTTLLLKKPFLDNALGRIATLQYVNCKECWPENILKGEVDLSDVQRFVVSNISNIFFNMNQLDFATSSELLQILYDFPPSISLPILIDELTNPDVAIRGTAFSTIQIILLNKFNIEEKFHYNERATKNKLVEAKDRVEKWFQEVRDKLKDEDVSKLKNEAESKIVLKQRTANLFLKEIFKK